MDFEFLILGPLEVHRDGHALPIGPPKQRRLLAALLLHANAVVPMTRLVHAVWGHEPPASATANLRSYAARLRQTLTDPDQPAGSRLVRRRPGYLLVVRPGELDLARFDERVTRARAAYRRGTLPEASTGYGEALRLRRGAAAADVDRDDWLGALLNAVDERCGMALEEHAGIRLSLGEHHDLVPELERELAAQPLRERLWGRLMVARYRSGGSAAAVATFNEAQRVLVEQLGVPPGPELYALHRAVLHGDLHPRPMRQPAAFSAPPPHELPPEVPTFVGHEERLAATRAALVRPSGRNLVVVHGPGGVGKSAFAVRVAHGVAVQFPDGQLYVDLHGATEGLRPSEPAAVLARFLRALGVPAAELPADPEEAAARFRSVCAARRLLVVLDNAAGEAQVRSLLPAASGCAVLVTSRSSLGALDASHTERLRPLDAVSAASLLQRLCGERRMAAEPDQAEELLRLSEGLPLAVRIIGARLATRPDRPVGALAAELRDERRRLDGLRFGDLAVRSSFQLSYRSLVDDPSPDSQRAAALFRLLGLLRVPTVDAAVAGALLDVPTVDAEVALDRLVAAHLIQVSGPGRYGMYDLLRLFAAECLAADAPPWPPPEPGAGAT